MLHNNRKRKAVLIATIERSREFGYDVATHLNLEDTILRKTDLRNVVDCPERIQDDNLRQRRRNLRQFISSLGFSPDGIMLVATAGENLHLFDPNRGRLVNTVWDPHNKVDVCNASFYSDKKFFCTTTSGCIGFWDTRKLDSPMNFFKAHSNYITKILYDKQSEWLLTADEDGQLHYWFVPAFETKGVNILKDHCGSLTNCPKLTQMCISKDGLCRKLLLSSTTNSSLFIINNLNLEELAKNQELNNLTIGENFKMYLGMNPRITYEGYRNNITYIDQDEFTPTFGVNIISVSHMESFPDAPIILLRLTTNDVPLTGGSIVGNCNKRDWTLCLKLKNRRGFNSHNLFHSYGSNVMHECLLYSIEEPRFCTLNEKKNCISPCNRLIASPQRNGIKLLSFSEKYFHDIEDAVQSTKKQHSLPSIFSSSSGPQSFHEHAMLRFDSSVKAYPLCCNFSPICSSLLAVGDSSGRVSFYQPHLS